MEDTKTPLPEAATPDTAESETVTATPETATPDATAIETAVLETAAPETVTAAADVEAEDAQSGAKPKFKLFDYDAPIPKYLREHGKLHGILMLLLTFVVVPIASILVISLTCNSVGLRVVQTTVSMLAWFNGKLAEVYVWGMINIALYAYLLVLNMDGEQYSGRAKIAFYVLFGLSVVILLTGLSIRFTEEHTLAHKLHNSLAIIGFVLAVLVLIAFIITQFWRNLTQAVIMTAFLCFFVITGVFSIPQVNSPDADAIITAASQMYIFAMMHVLFALNYCLSKLLPAKKKARQNSKA